MKKAVRTKRLVKQSTKYIPMIGDTVIFKNHPYDKLPYEVKQILPDGTVFMESSNGAYTGISPRTISLLTRKEMEQ